MLDNAVRVSPCQTSFAEPAFEENLTTASSGGALAAIIPGWAVGPQACRRTAPGTSPAPRGQRQAPLSQKSAKD